jgi:hypothetical protein
MDEHRVGRPERDAPPDRFIGKERDGDAAIRNQESLSYVGKIDDLGGWSGAKKSSKTDRDCSVFVERKSYRISLDWRLR